MTVDRKHHVSLTLTGFFLGFIAGGLVTALIIFMVLGR